MYDWNADAAAVGGKGCTAIIVSVGLELVELGRDGASNRMGHIFVGLTVWINYGLLSYNCSGRSAHLAEPLKIVFFLVYHSEIFFIITFLDQNLAKTISPQLNNLHTIWVTLSFKIIFGLNHLAMFIVKQKLLNYLKRS
jgi:hypothetical protein